MEALTVPQREVVGWGITFWTKAARNLSRGRSFSARIGFRGIGGAGSGITIQSMTEALWAEAGGHCS
ncbi:hypothetical protein NDU88_002375 [Pleurodeles waltl]|uniref:Uncharacterized protein n=1 Tax=Pleurodeles waltl TaxID=8319 RepID=A0AAV7RFE6_PLEWA|nr:hypothetical protein NDU88_002375 [Pleurodeles waltl]